ncbi:MAG: TonB-dependent receptor, partial [Bacteroidales bacterium]
EGIEWIADFGKIPVIYTSFRFDGNYYHYRGVNETMIASTPVSSQNMASGLPYKYIGFYAGTNMSTASPKVANGSETHRVNANLTATTHIPRIRLLISLRLESTLYHSSQNLSEFNVKARGIVIESRDEYTGTSSDIYGGDRYVAVYPEYYVSADDMNTRIPFEKAFLDAKANNPELYNELAKLVLKSNTSYYFNQDRLSPYFSVNLSVTKEIGKHFSLSFYANNFLNNLSKVTSSANNTESSLYNSTRIPYFDYGIMLKIKL